MKNRWFTIVLVIILLAGAGLMLYPVVSDQINRFKQSRAIENYNQDAGSDKQEEYAAMLFDAEAYNKTLFERGALAEVPEDMLLQYHSILNPKGDGVIGYVQIPKIKVNLTIGHTVDEEVLRTQAGHIPGSSFPIGGENVHAVLSAHRGLPSATLFSDLDQLEPGDTFLIHVLDHIYEYRVVEVNIVLPEETELLNIVPGKNYATLMTCTPYGINTHRMLVRGEMIADKRLGESQTDQNESGFGAFLVQYQQWLFPGAIAALILLFLIVLLLRRRGKK